MEDSLRGPGPHTKALSQLPRPARTTRLTLSILGGKGNRLENRGLNSMHMERESVHATVLLGWKMLGLERSLWRSLFELIQGELEAGSRMDQTKAHGRADYRDLAGARVACSRNARNLSPAALSMLLGIAGCSIPLCRLRGPRTSLRQRCAPIVTPKSLDI